MTTDGDVLFHNLDRQGQGICLYMQYDLRPSLCGSLDSTIEESIFVKYQLEGSKTLLLGLAYRRPRSFQESKVHLNKLITVAAEKKTPLADPERF